jgi:hypothetical protein
VTCAICKTRKPRRQCPGVQGEICSICCAREREESIDCPLDCTYLQDAHEHERPPELDPATLPNQDIEVAEEFLRERELLLAFVAVTVLEGALQSAGATDWDIREALESLIATWRTLQSGLYYENLPVNPYAASIATYVRKKIQDVKNKEFEETGERSLSDSDILIVLVFLQRLEYSNNNGRKRSRAFLDFLRGFYDPAIIGDDDEDDGADLQEPDEPLVIL